MFATLLLALTFGQLSFFFMVGHVACPRRDRIPLRDMTRDDVVGTVVRGWNSIGSNWREKGA